MCDFLVEIAISENPLQILAATECPQIMLKSKKMCPQNRLKKYKVY
jgi:hypothetical protein